MSLPLLSPSHPESAEGWRDSLQPGSWLLLLVLGRHIFTPAPLH